MEPTVKDTENCNGNKEDPFFSLFTGGNLKENFEFDQLTSDLYDHFRLPGLAWHCVFGHY